MSYDRRKKTFLKRLDIITNSYFPIELLFKDKRQTASFSLIDPLYTRTPYTDLKIKMKKNYQKKIKLIEKSFFL